MNEELFIPDKKQLVLTGSGLLLMITGYTLIGLDGKPYGFGFTGLTAGPVLVVSGLIMPLLAIIKLPPRKASWLLTSFQNPHIITGWGLFLLSLFLYIRTLEPTASLWDCGEYIACAYKLEIPHEPGNPLFSLLGRLSSMLAFGNTDRVAFWVNMLSAVSSAGTVMLIFWTIEMMVFRIRKYATSEKKVSSFTAIFAGLTGAGIFAVSDSFWYSAVEAETYALATFFTILPVWSAFKCEKADIPGAKSRWLLFIAYSYGLVIGAHQMALLTIPAVVLIIGLHTGNPDLRRLAKTSVLGIILLFFVSQAIVFGLPSYLKWLDIIMVNELHLPFNTGVVTGIVTLGFCVGWLYRTGIRKTNRNYLNIAYTFFLILFGFSTYTLLPVRSIHNPPIDENNPDDISRLVSYISRDSYPKRPLLFGPYFDAGVREYRKTKTEFSREQNRYKIGNQLTEAIYDPGRTTIFPRMYSNDADHIETYRAWTGLKKRQKPGFSDNLLFMFRYQLGHMYWRYFMWNFSGRDNDIMHAGWLNPLSDLFNSPAGNSLNKAHNNYYMLPFILGLIGFLFQWKWDKRSFYPVVFLFLFMGIVLVLYLNSTPNEPRERDYIYVGSYLAYALWCGLGAFAIINGLRFPRTPSMPVIAGILLILIPAMMCYENFDDHDRSGRFLQIDYARNILASCEPDSILFTGGDNDTFPLWYVQEVEGFRTDVRVIVLSYFNASWYIEQMTRKAYESDPLPISLDKKTFKQGGPIDILPVVENPGIRGAINLEQFLGLVRMDHRALKVRMSDGDEYTSIPSNLFFLPVDKQAVLRSGLIPHGLESTVPDRLTLKIKNTYITKNTFMVLEIIARNQWQRPVYFNYTSLNTAGINLAGHVVQTGSLYRLLPVDHDERDIPVDLDRMYENLMIKAQYRNLDGKKVYYHTEDYQYRIIQPIHNDLNTLGDNLMDADMPEKARKVAGFITDHLNSPDQPFNYTWLQTAKLFFRMQINEKGDEIVQKVYDDTVDYLKTRKTSPTRADPKIRLSLFTMQQIGDLWSKTGDEEKARRCRLALNDFIVYWNK